MTFSAQAGSIKAKAHNALGAIVEFVIPGIVTTWFECKVCGARVEPSNASGHLKYFHPEAK